MTKTSGIFYLSLSLLIAMVSLVIYTGTNVIKMANEKHTELMQGKNEAKQGKLIFEKDGVKVYRIHDYKDHWICISSNSVSIQE